MKDQAKVQDHVTIGLVKQVAEPPKKDESTNQPSQDDTTDHRGS